MTLLELADEVERAEGASHELDMSIATACYTHGFGGVNYDPALWLVRYGGFCNSLDAAATLVPEGMDFGVSREQGRGVAHTVSAQSEFSVDSIGATPELALIAAALRARAAIKG